MKVSSKLRDIQEYEQKVNEAWDRFRKTEKRTERSYKVFGISKVEKDSIMKKAKSERQEAVSRARAEYDHIKGQSK